MIRRSIGTRLAAAYLVPSLLGLGALGVWVDRLARRALEEELGRKAVAVAAAAAATVPAERLSFLQPGDEETRTFGHFRDRLELLRTATGVRRLALFLPDERALVDAGGAARIGEPLPELARDRVELARALAGTPTSSQVLFEHDGRSFKTGYAPVRLEGRVVAVVLAEAPAEWFAAFAEFRTRLLLGGLFATAAIVVLAFLFAGTLAAPIKRLAAAARRIGRGDLATPVEAAGTDELGTLARTVDEMREALLARERQLQLMLAGIAHEVRNPLGGMDLYSGLLLEELADRPEQAAHVRRIRREIDGLSRLVGDFLDWAREKPAAPEVTTARPLLEETASLLAALAARHGVALEVTGDAALRCDPGLLRRALLNLGKNAIEAAPAGSVVRLVATEAGGRVRLAAEDRGPGVPPELAERIFEPFFTTKERGTGLGLAFVRKIAVAHGGAARVEPTPGGGATFVLDLPEGGPAAPTVRAAG